MRHTRRTRRYTMSAMEWFLTNFEKIVCILFEMDEGNDLLRFWLLQPGEGCKERITSEFKDRFWGRDIPWKLESQRKVSTVAILHYLFALDRAIKSKSD